MPQICDYNRWHWLIVLTDLALTLGMLWGGHLAEYGHTCPGPRQISPSRSLAEHSLHTRSSILSLHQITAAGKGQGIYLATNRPWPRSWRTNAHRHGALVYIMTHRVLQYKDNDDTHQYILDVGMNMAWDGKPLTCFITSHMHWAVAFI